MKPTASLWDAWPIRHTLMVACTTAGNPRDSFVKRPGQTSMYYRYGPWHCHVSAPHWGHLMDWRSYQKKFTVAHLSGVVVRCLKGSPFDKSLLLSA
jgi:hypothetical protein